MHTYFSRVNLYHLFKPTPGCEKSKFQSNMKIHFTAFLYFSIHNFYFETRYSNFFFFIHDFVIFDYTFLLSKFCRFFYLFVVKIVFATSKFRCRKKNSKNYYFLIPWTEHTYIFRNIVPSPLYEQQYNKIQCNADSICKRKHYM